VWWQERVGHRQAGEHRHRVQHQRLAAALGGHVDQRRQHEDADVEEDRDAEDQTEQAHRDGRAAFAEYPEQLGHQNVGAARPFEDGAQDGAEPDDHRDVSEDGPETRLEDRIAALDRSADDVLDR